MRVLRAYANCRVDVVWRILGEAHGLVIAENCVFVSFRAQVIYNRASKSLTCREGGLSLWLSFNSKFCLGPRVLHHGLWDEHKGGQPA